MNETPQPFANDGPLHFALRRLRQRFSAPRTYSILAAVTLILVLSGPYGTGDDMALPARLVFWSLSVFLCYGAGEFFGALTGRRLAATGIPRPAALVLTGLAAGIAILPIVLTLNAAFFPAEVLQPSDLLIQALQCVVICCAVTFNLALFRAPETARATQPAGASGAAEGASQGRALGRDLGRELAAERGTDLATERGTDRLLSRLPPEKRGRIIALSAEDHYVAVETSKGRSLLLMRLKDAIAEVDHTPGLQIHRSHWAALSGIERAERENGKPVLVTRTGTKLAVSRTYLDAVKEHGYF